MVCECVKVYVVSICYALCKCSACVWCVGVCVSRNTGILCPIEANGKQRKRSQCILTHLLQCATVRNAREIDRAPYALRSSRHCSIRATTRYTLKRIESWVLTVHPRQLGSKTDV